MGGRSWTELFFLDEATAFAAGHRPCFFCRREDANRFRAAWQQGNRLGEVFARDIDAVLQGERLAAGKKRLHSLPVPMRELPEGTMLHDGSESYLLSRAGRCCGRRPAIARRLWRSKTPCCSPHPRHYARSRRDIAPCCIQARALASLLPQRFAILVDAHPGSRSSSPERSAGNAVAPDLGPGGCHARGGCLRRAFDRLLTSDELFAAIRAS